MPNRALSLFLYSLFLFLSFSSLFVILGFVYYRTNKKKLVFYYCLFSLLLLLSLFGEFAVFFPFIRRNKKTQRITHFFFNVYHTTTTYEKEKNTQRQSSSLLSVDFFERFSSFAKYLRFFAFILVHIDRVSFFLSKYFLLFLLLLIDDRWLHKIKIKLL